MHRRQWVKKDVDRKLVRAVAGKYSCDALAAYILASRGITTDNEIRCFLTDDISLLCDPFLLPDIEKAVRRIRQARAKNEKVLIFGDRDVDGIAATVLLVDYLQCLGVSVSRHIPIGDEPYGLSMQAVEDFSAEGGTLIITVDCGISGVSEIARANELGIDVIVTDHHTPKDILPEALAIINPKLPNSSYPFPDIAGCMIAYKLILALQETLGEEGVPYYSQKENQYIQLAALGTVADIVPLQNENRVIVRNGLKAVMEKPRYGLSELLIALELAGKRITAKELGWLVCPAINAAGENISRGITGIMANRLTERFHIPAMVVHLGGEIAVGSIRSPGNYDIRLLIEPADDILLNWGGHTNALGFSLNRSLWEQFIDRLEIEVCYISCTETPDDEPLIVDAELPLGYISPDIFAVVDRFEPYGTGNEPLVFVSKGIKVMNAYLLGKTETKHLKMTVDTGKCRWPAVFWNAADNGNHEIKAGDTVDIVYSFERDSYRKRDTPQMLVKGLRKSVS